MSSRRACKASSGPRKGVPGLGDDEAVRLLRMMGRDQWDQTHGTVLRLVEGRPTEDRMTLYRTFAEHCVRFGARGSGVAEWELAGRETRRMIHERAGGGRGRRSWRRSGAERT